MSASVTLPLNMPAGRLSASACVMPPVPRVPSPKSQENVGLTTVDDDALRNTVSLMPGEVGEKVKLAWPEVFDMKRVEDMWNTYKTRFGQMCLCDVELSKPKNYRYQEFRRKYGPERYWWFSLFQVFWLQGLLAFLVSPPLLVVASAPSFGSVDLLWLGVAFWLVGKFASSFCVANWTRKQASAISLEFNRNCF